MNEFTKIFAKTIEDEAIKQIETLSNSEAYNSCKIRIMPDCHAGKGCTIGTVIELDNRVVPNTVGVDIGCGMKVVRLGKVDIDLQKFDEAVNKLIPSGFNVNEGEVSAYINGLVDGCMFGKFRAWDCLDSMEIVYRSVGSLGGGNHFIELDANEEGEKFLVIHTGSRNLGVRVCNYYQKLAYEYCRKKIADKSEVIAKLKSEGRENEIQSVIKSLGTKNISKELSYLEGDLLDDYFMVMQQRTLYHPLISEIFNSKVCKIRVYGAAYNLRIITLCLEYILNDSSVYCIEHIGVAPFNESLLVNLLHKNLTTAWVLWRHTIPRDCDCHRNILNRRNHHFAIMLLYLILEIVWCTTLRCNGKKWYFIEFAFLL